MRLISVLVLGVVLAGCGAGAPVPQPESHSSTAVDEIVNEDESSKTATSNDGILEATAKMYGLTEEMTSGIEVVREIKPGEWDQVNHDCMESFGFPELPDGGGWSVPEEQSQAYGLAVYSCLVMYPYAEIYTKPNGEKEHRRFYDYWGNTVLPCLKEKGYATRELPSFEVFRATAGTSEEYYPVGEALTDPRFNEATEACKVLPSADYILGLTNTP